MEDENVNQSGFLDVGDGHNMYWEDWGNSEAEPFLYVHGGPGQGFRPHHKQMFDPRNNRVIFYDQRGAGKSTPFAETENNTTQELVNDIEKLREHLGIDQYRVFGNSWGSTLSLVYAIKHPDRVKNLILTGVYLGTKFESEYISGGYPRYNYPEAWERFISRVPEELRTDGTSITQFYADKMNNSDDEAAQDYADEWSLWESSLLSVLYDKDELESEVIGDPSNLPLAKLETQYFLNNCYIPDNFILDSIEKIKHIPCHIIQGRFDNCTPPAIAYRLSKAYGPNASLQFVHSGHRQSDPELLAAIRATVSSLS